MNTARIDEFNLDATIRRVKKRCNGMLNERVYRAIFEAARSGPDGDIIEIGTAHGAATVSLALGVQQRPKETDCRIYTIEKIVGGSRCAYGGVEDNVAIIKDNFIHFGVNGQIELNVGDSESVACRIPNDNPVSLLMIDADGRIDRDLFLYYNRLVPGGHIIIDDCLDVPRVKRMGRDRMRIDLKHKLTFHLVKYFSRKGLLHDAEEIDGTVFARKPSHIQGDIEFDFGEIVEVYRGLVFSEAVFPGISREVIERGLKAVHGKVKSRPVLYRAWKRAQRHFKRNHEKVPTPGIRG